MISLREALMSNPSLIPCFLSSTTPKYSPFWCLGEDFWSLETKLQRIYLSFSSHPIKNYLKKPVLMAWGLCFHFKQVGQLGRWGWFEWSLGETQHDFCLFNFGWILIRKEYLFLENDFHKIDYFSSFIYG